MAKIDRLDLETKHIYLAVGVREFHPVDDVYKEVRILRRTIEEYRGFDMPVVASGNVAKGGGKYTPRLATFRSGWKIVPEDVSHVLYVSGEQITDQGEAGPACFDLEPLSASSKVIIQYEPPSAEIIETGVSGLTEEESNSLMAIQAVKAKTDRIPVYPAYEGEYNTPLNDILIRAWQPAEKETVIAAAEDIPFQLGEVQFQQVLLNEIATTVMRVVFGRWKIQDNQLIFYDENDQPMRVFNLLDKEGRPTEITPYERVPVK